MNRFRRNVFSAAALSIAAIGVMGAWEESAVSAGAASAASAGFAVDPVHSALVFRISHNTVGTFFGRFNKLEGTFNLDAANPSAGSMEFTVTTESVDTGNSKRDNHLKSGDFFNVKQFPTSTFKAKSFTKTGEGTYDVDGELTLMGVTKPVQAKVERAAVGSGEGGKHTAGFQATFTVKRSEFGMTKYADMLGDEVTVMVGIEGGK